MDPLPSLWRVELLHPMVVHLPLVLLPSGTALWLVGRWTGDEGRWSFLTPAGRLALLVGALSAWLAVYTGDWANSEVARSLCDPTVAERHEEWAYIVGYLFTGGIAVDLGLHLSSMGAHWKRGARVAAALAFATGTGLVGLVGHLGARLVYQQGAAVHHPSEDCSDFAD